MHKMIYILAKVAIVDDAAFTVGSANLNLRSMALDSELNILSQAHEVAYQLRADLFHQCSEDSGPEKFGDMAWIFDKWVKMMSANASAKIPKKSLKGKIVIFEVDRKPGAPIV